MIGWWHLSAQTKSYLLQHAGQQYIKPLVQCGCGSLPCTLGEHSAIDHSKRWDVPLSISWITSYGHPWRERSPPTASMPRAFGGSVLQLRMGWSQLGRWNQLGSGIAHQGNDRALQNARGVFEICCRSLDLDFHRCLRFLSHDNSI